MAKCNPGRSLSVKSLWRSGLVGAKKERECQGHTDPVGGRVSLTGVVIGYEFTARDYRISGRDLALAGEPSTSLHGDVGCSFLVHQGTKANEGIELDVVHRRFE